MSRHRTLLVTGVTALVASGFGAPSQPATGAAAMVRVTDGVVERVSVERNGFVGRTAAIATWVRTASGRVQVPTAAVATVPAGGRVQEWLGRWHATALSQPGPLVQPTAANRTHLVTIALVVPPGGRRDTTTPASLTASVNHGVSAFWSQQTGGRVRLTVTRTLGWTNVSSPCKDYFRLWDEVARRSGFVPGPRRHLVVYVTTAGKVGHCYAGLGTIGSSINSGGDAYIRGTQTGLIAHELGHNLGLGHSNGLQCNETADSGWSGHWLRRCSRAAYRDWYDVMGLSWDRLGTLATAHAYQLGVLRPDAVFTTSTPTLAVLSGVSSHRGLQSLRVVDPTGVTYTVEYRPAVGRDSWLVSNWRGLRPGVLVRRFDPVGGMAETLLLDPSPSAVGGWSNDWDEALQAGEMVTTASGRTAIRVEAMSATSATIAVAVDGEWPPTQLSRPVR